MNVESCGERRVIIEGIGRREKEKMGRHEEVERGGGFRIENVEDGAVMKNQYEEIQKEETTAPRSPEGLMPNPYESPSMSRASPPQAQQSASSPEKEEISAKLWQKSQFLTNHHKSTTTTPTQTTSSPQPQPSGRKVLLSERLKGDFHRTFTFRETIREEGIRATMENGVLEVVVPKAERGIGRVGRKVRVERGSENGRGFGFVSGAF